MMLPASRVPCEPLHVTRVDLRPSPVRAVNRAQVGRLPSQDLPIKTRSRDCADVAVDHETVSTGQLVADIRLANIAWQHLLRGGLGSR